MADQEADRRDDHGRFAPGNPGGPGRPRGRPGAELRRAAEEAITAEHIAAIIRKATRMALEGNLSAMRFVLDRTCGRPAEVPAEAVELDLALPNMSTAASCNVALDRIVDAICKGTVDREAAKLMVNVIQARLRAIEVNDLRAVPGARDGSHFLRHRTRTPNNRPVGDHLAAALTRADDPGMNKTPVRRSQEEVDELLRELEGSGETAAEFAPPGRAAPTLGGGYPATYAKSACRWPEQREDLDPSS